MIPEAHPRSSGGPTTRLHFQQQILDSPRSLPSVYPLAAPTVPSTAKDPEFGGSRFFMVFSRHRRPIASIRSLRPYFSEREFWSDWIDDLSDSLPKPRRIAEEVLARTLRYPFLSHQEKVQERSILETLAGPLFMDVLSLASAPQEEPSLPLVKAAIRNLQRILEVDARIRKICRTFPDCPPNEGSDIDPEWVNRHLHQQNTLAIWKFLRRFPPTETPFTPGGRLQLEGVRENRSFPLQQGMKPITSGQAFAEDFDIRSLQKSRPEPVFLRITYGP